MMFLFEVKKNETLRFDRFPKRLFFFFCRIHRLALSRCREGKMIAEMRIQPTRIV